MATTKGKEKYRISVIWIEVPVEVYREDFEAVDPVPSAKRLLTSNGFALNEDYVVQIKRFNHRTQRYRMIGELRGVEKFKVFHPAKGRK